MRKYTLLLPLVYIVIGFTACSDTPARPGCRIKGEISFNEYETVYLIAPAGNKVDSCDIKNGKFYLEETDSIASPYVATIHMAAKNDPSDILDMPVAVENGTVKVGLGEYIKLSGTPLNDRIKGFLDALQQCKDGATAKDGITAEEVIETFSQFYKQQILSNKDNIVGEYIYGNYGQHLNAADKELVKAQIGN